MGSTSCQIERRPNYASLYGLSRRDFLKKSSMAGIALSSSGLLADQYRPLGKPEDGTLSHQQPHPLRILILGGTSFLGPHQIAYAMQRGHSITTFTRGRTQPTIHKGLFKEVEQLIGDRENNLEALKNRKWDAVIDNSGRRAAWTRDTARLLRENVDVYLYTSSTGVYYPYLGRDFTEDTTLNLETPEGVSEYESMEYGYGVMKSLSEKETKTEFGKDRSIIVRPTYMMGPADRTDRFTYWPVRLSRGGEVMIPGHHDDPVQYIDVRDVAGFMIRLIEKRTTGTFNAVGPASSTGIHRFVYGAHAVFSSAASFIPVSDYAFLLSQGVQVAIPWIMPTGNDAGSARVNNKHGINHGLTFRPLAESVRDIYEWWHSEAVSDERRAKMINAEDSLIVREPSILAAWKSR